MFCPKQKIAVPEFCSVDGIEQHQLGLLHAAAACLRTYLNAPSAGPDYTHQ